MNISDIDKKRFWHNVEKTADCWLWTGYITQARYGQFSINHTTSILSHRQSWLFAGNTIPDGHLIRHKCRSRNCCNPEHLETGTPQQNADDRERDETTARGEKIGTSKLTEQQVREIRAIPRKRNFLQALADKYDVSIFTIREVRKFKTWKHI